MIWHTHEGEMLRCGINWHRSDVSMLAVMVHWRGSLNMYVCGVRIRSRTARGPRIIWRPLLKACRLCHMELDRMCERHGGAALRVMARLTGNAA